MLKREAKFQSKFNEWLRTQFKRTGAFELKETLGPLPFSRVEEHQVNALKAVKEGTFVYKISDMSLGAKPFDCFSFSRSKAYVVVLYRTSRTFYGIDIDDFLLERQRGPRKSLLESRAKEINCFCSTL